MPVVFELYQRRVTRLKKRELMGYLKREMSRAGETLGEELGAKFEVHAAEVESKLGQLREEIERESARARGSAHHLQVSLALGNKDYCVALVSSVWGARAYLRGGDEVNLQRLLGAIGEECLPKVTWEQVLEYHAEAEGDVDELLDRLRAENTEGRYTNYIEDIVRNLRAAKKRGSE